MSITTGPVLYTRFDTRLGVVILTSEGVSLTGFFFEGQKHFKGVQPDWQDEPELPLIVEVMRQYRQYEQRERKRFDVPLRLHGTPFQQRVWNALRTIDFGATTSYGDLARSIGAASAVRAVGAAVGRNPVSVIVPCHRVLGAQGALTGYAGGLPRKEQLLMLEGARMV